MPSRSDDVPVVPASLDPDALLRLSEEVLSETAKSLPENASGHTVAGFLATGPRLSDCWTPVLVLTDSALRRNAATMGAWCATRNLDLAPHGKTTMAPALWQRQLEAGSWGITVATPWQLRVAIGFGARTVLLANSLVDPIALAWLGRTLDRLPELTVLVWADSVESVALMTGVLEAPGRARQVQVLVELGGEGGRTGVRGVQRAIEVARAVRASPALQLSGVAGYEGALGHDPSAAALARIRSYLRALADLHAELLELQLYESAEIFVTAGGSAYFDDVADLLAPAAGFGPGSARTRVVLRSGAYLVHDDGFYAGISPFSRGAGAALRSAMHLYARVISAPEPGLALLDAGKRDLPYDEGLPTVQTIADALGAPQRPLAGRITAVNDQHAFFRFDPTVTQVRVGQVVRLGLSHPCTAFDKWQWIPVIADEPTEHSPDPVVTDLVRTFF